MSAVAKQNPSDTETSKTVGAQAKLRGHGRVLSIQSHVVHGYVGNDAATFPLQVLGFEVDAIHSVQFSNHTGYKHFKGQVLGSLDLESIMSGLRSNNLLHYSHVLTGYIGSVSFLEKVSEVVTELKRMDKTVCYICDPVLGDDGDMYVPKELLSVYKEKLVPIADIITPNQYEAEWLSDVAIKSQSDAFKAIDRLLDMGAQTVIITSTFVETGQSQVLLGKNKNGEITRVEMPKIKAHFTGTGDLFNALLLAWSHEGLQSSCEKAVCTMQAVLRRTLQHYELLSGTDCVSAVEKLELRLIQSKKDIESPPSSPYST